MAISPSGNMISYGLKGSADIIGLLNTGRFLAVEVKTGMARQTKEQKAFQQMIDKLGGLYIVARSTLDVAAL